ncbi:hypothetical protein [Planococcus sp. ISL-109]|uniref:hypothetical protein n=1 Tax=Planococcus sp. ISL-109 TaxID=2819166 RepID=UPI001BEA3837|nr:hypothetical protein [Planococcus sp. ISL-109]MBT2584228.1 hypothetical protein [Planococcus sp. ISL-109]
MNKRFTYALLVALVYGVIIAILSYVMGGQVNWNSVIGSAIAGFILFAFVWKSRENKRLAKQQQEEGRI